MLMNLDTFKIAVIPFTLSLLPLKPSDEEVSKLYSKARALQLVRLRMY